MPGTSRYAENIDAQNDQTNSWEWDSSGWDEMLPDPFLNIDPFLNTDPFIPCDGLSGHSRSPGI